MSRENFLKSALRKLFFISFFLSRLCGDFFFFAFAIDKVFDIRQWFTASLTYVPVSYSFAFFLVTTDSAQYTRHFPLSFRGACRPIKSVMEDQSYDMLLGLDMLRKHQATIDLRNNCLRMGSSSAPFLPEHRIPYHMRALADAAHSNPAATVDTNAAEQNTVGGRNLGSDRGNAFNSDEIISQTAGQAALIRANKQKADALVVLGFSRSDADRALIACDGHQDRAAMLLIEEKFGS